MDAKDLKIEPAPSERNSDGSKYAQSGTALQCNKNRPYQDIGSNPSAKVDAASARPCAIIGPDRVVPPTEPNDAYIKKAQVEPWPCPESLHHRPPEYLHKAPTYHNPTRNISPRQTFQENMQRIMVPPTYNSIKVNEDPSFIQKLSVTPDAKYCDVPYSFNSATNDLKNMRSVEMCLPNVSSALGRPPHGWAPSAINIRPQRPYVSSDIYQYPDYPSCAGPRPIAISRQQRTIPEESGYIYPEQYYQEPNIRFKPYPNVKERYPQPRYDYVTNYSNPFHPPPCPPQKYEISKQVPPHPYSGHPHFKYIDSRMPESILEGYQRPIGQQGSYNLAYRNQIMHPAYGPMLSNNTQSKMSPYPPDGSFKAVSSNKLPLDSNGKIHVEYDNARTKPVAPSESFYPNEMSRHHSIPKNAMLNYPPISMHSLPPHSYYKRENTQIKNYEYINHYKNFNPSINMNGPMHRLIPQFSPNGVAISPTDSNTSNDTLQTHSTSQEDCGYVSQSSTTSVRSIDLGNSRIPNDYYGGYYDPRYGPVIRTTPTSSKTIRNNNSGSTDNKDKKDMDVRKFLQMWNEGDDDHADISSSKEIFIQNSSNELSNTSKPYGAMNNQEQLYVLGLVHVPSEDLSKYEHIQKVSKLPENIKGYSNLELLNQFEEVIESSNMNGFKLPTSKEFQTPTKQCVPKQSIAMLPRPISPLDVEAKISQSVIHKEVGCNFEIKPCSPKMLNVDIASPAQNILNERVIEKVTNPLSMISPPILNGIDNIEHCKIPETRQGQRVSEDNEKISSCKMINTQFSKPNTHSVKTNYSIQDLESNAGVCLASLPRLDNDIELNFPEVNQQFINANKGEPVIPTQIKDLPKFCELNQTNKILSNFKRENFETSALSPKIETEREFTKLSKYRKMKTNISNGRLDKSASKVIRTDSVIIKNPENTKTFESDDEQYDTNKINQMDQQNCTDLMSHVDFVVDKTPGTNVLNETKLKNVAHNALDMAVDYSLHKDADKNFKLNHNVTKTYESIQLSKDEVLLNKCKLYENKDEVPKCFEINKIGMFTNETNSDISYTEKETKNIVSNFNIDSIVSSSESENLDLVVSSSESENLGVPDIVNTVNESFDLPTSPHNNTKCQNISKNEILEAQLPIVDVDKTIVETFNNCDKEILPQLQVDPNIGSPNDIEIKNEIHKVVTCDVSYEQSKVIKPTEDVKVLDTAESPESELPFSKGDTMDDVDEQLLLNESTTVSPTITLNKEQIEQIDSVVFQKSYSHERFSQQLKQKENWTKHTVNLIFCDSKNKSEINHMSNIDEGFTIIDEKQNCHEETNSNKDVVNEVHCKNDINIESIPYVSKCFGYGSKELYSPWIQKLIMFDEGFCCALSSHKSKLSNQLEVDDLLAISGLDDIDSATCSNHVNDGITETSESTVSESIDNNTCSDSILQSENDLQIEVNSSLSPTYCEQLNIQNKKCDEHIYIQDNLSMNIQSDEDTNDNEKDKTIKKDFLCEQDGRTRRKTTCETVISETTAKDYSHYELDIKKQSTGTNSEYAIEKDENKIKVTPSISPTNHRLSLKRSLSDSALNTLYGESRPDRRDLSAVWPIKRSKVVDTENQSEIIAQNLCNILQHNRRNSVSAVYNDNVSFCILIEDNSILTEENDETGKLCYTELSEDCLNEIQNAYTCGETNIDITSENVTCNEETNCEYSNINLSNDHDIPLDETWVDDVACIETVVSDDIAEDIVINAVSTPKEINFWDDEESDDYVNSDKEDNGLTDKPKYNDDILKLCQMPQINIDKTLIFKGSQSSNMFLGLYDTEALEKILSESNSREGSPFRKTEYVIPSESPKCIPDDKENMDIILSESNTKEKCFNAIDLINQENSSKTCQKTQDVTVNSCESSIDNVFSCNPRDDRIKYTTSSSPEVSSTTSEEKSSSLLLKITNYKCTKISQSNNFNTNNKNISCKFTEKTDYANSNIKLNPNRPLITKAAQKYIPPIKEPIRDLKVKLSLPQHSLLKLKQIKTSKDEPKPNKQTNVPYRLPKKPKPKFEDVLKSIDEIQIKMHKEKTKKVKKTIPKVVIKKNENGSHYASTSNKDKFNPDLTGRKWQPWVFLEKNNFIDKMAMRRKSKAIFSHRKNAYVLAEKFHKYKSASSTKFVISQPKLCGSSTGQLKYTIRLKHSY